MLECDKPRKDCYDACTTAACKDECDDEWVPREVCCHRLCPCHTGCPDGCPCTGDWNCPPPELNNNDFCHISGIEFPEPDQRCLDEWQEVVTECVTPCKEASYECAVACEKGDIECVNNCKTEEYNCKKQCPCYEDCPQGCPCPHWCGTRPCYDIFSNEKLCCEDKAMTIWLACQEECKELDPGAQPLCYDICLEEYLEIFDSCPCHRECTDGCPCNNEISAENLDCCEDFSIPDPISNECTLLWEPEMLECRDHCFAQTQACINDCDYENELYDGEFENCRNNCTESMFECINHCPCYDLCPYGCPCDYYLDFPNFCPNKIPDARCLKTGNNTEEMYDCHHYCHQENHECVILCPEYNMTDTNMTDAYGFEDLIFFDEEEGNLTCLEQCRENGILCPLGCPCHEDCPNGCPCGYVSEDCIEAAPMWFPTDPDLVWCADDVKNHTHDEICAKLWDDEREECTGYCDFVESGCKSRCQKDHQGDIGEIEACENQCDFAHGCCLEDCPCNEKCPHGCPCTAVECPGGTCVCPEIPVNQTCLEKWGQYAKRCDFDCMDAGYDCIENNCTMTDEDELHDCYDECKNLELECIYDCPCYRDCPNGCDKGDCPTVSKLFMKHMSGLLRLFVYQVCQY